MFGPEVDAYKRLAADCKRARNAIENSSPQASCGKPHEDLASGISTLLECQQTYYERLAEAASERGTFWAKLRLDGIVGLVKFLALLGIGLLAGMTIKQFLLTHL